MKHHLGKTIAIIEILSPGNKDTKAAIRDFLDKTFEFLRAGALRQIAGDRDEIRLRFPDEGEQGLEDRGVHPVPGVDRAARFARVRSVDLPADGASPTGVNRRAARYHSEVVNQG